MLPINTCVSRAFFTEEIFQFRLPFFPHKNQIRVRVIRRIKKKTKKKTRPLCHHIKRACVVRVFDSIIQRALEERERI